MNTKGKHKEPANTCDLLKNSEILDEKYHILAKLQHILARKEYKKLKFINKIKKTLQEAQESHRVFIKTTSDGMKSLNEHTSSCLKDSESQYNEVSWFNKKAFNLNEETITRFEKFMQNRLNTLQNFEKSLIDRESDLNFQEFQLAENLKNLNSQISELSLAKQKFYGSPSFISDISLTDNLISSLLFVSIGMIIGFILLRLQHLFPFPKYS